MQIIFFAATMLCAGSLVWFLTLSDSRSAKENWDATVRSQVAEKGVRRLLQDNDRFDFSDLVIEKPDSAGRVVFRGLAHQDGIMRLTFGRADATCPQIAADPACWKIGLLEMDGRNVVVAENSTPAEQVPVEPNGKSSN